MVNDRYFRCGVEIAENSDFEIGIGVESLIWVSRNGF